MNVVEFHSEALIRLKTRVAALGEANSDLIAFARGHRGAVQQIHAAALAALDATCFEHLVHVVTRSWPDILRVDVVALALATNGQGIRAGAQGLQFVDPEEVELWCALLPMGTIRTVPFGAPVFGSDAPLVQAEALIALRPEPPLPAGVLALGSHQAQAPCDSHGSELLGFLGEVVSRMIARWMLTPHY